WGRWLPPAPVAPSTEPPASTVPARPDGDGVSPCARGAQDSATRASRLDLYLAWAPLLCLRRRAGWSICSLSLVQETRTASAVPREAACTASELGTQGMLVPFRALR